MVFVEVKSRRGRTDDELTGFENMDSRKCAALRRSCLLYRKKAPGIPDHYRLDVVTVRFGEGRRLEEIRWYPAVLDLDEG